MNQINTSNLPKAIFLMGTTSSGKTELSIKLRKFLPVELISVDSALIYRGMNIGTAKPCVDKLREAPHRLLDILDPSQTYSAARFYQDALSEMDDITSNGRIPLLVGGTMFYFKTLLNGLSPLPTGNSSIRIEIEKQALKGGSRILYQKLKKIDPASAERIHPNDKKRVSRALEVFFISGKTLTELTQTSGNPLKYQIYQFAITPGNRKSLHQKIEKRFEKMLSSGFEMEVRALFSRGDLHANMPSIRCVGYRQMWLYLEGKISYNEMIYRGICATRQLAKRQITWLRNWGGIIWLDNNQPDLALQKILRVVSDFEK